MTVTMPAAEAAREAARSAESDDFAGVSRHHLIRRIRGLLSQRAADILTIDEHADTITRLEARIVLLTDEPTGAEDVAAKLRHLADLVGSGKAGA